jgi:hypothetical protein
VVFISDPIDQPPVVPLPIKSRQKEATAPLGVDGGSSRQKAVGAKGDGAGGESSRRRRRVGLRVVCGGNASSRWPRVGRVEVD